MHNSLSVREFDITDLCHFFLITNLEWGVLYAHYLYNPLPNPKEVDILSPLLLAHNLEVINEKNVKYILSLLELSTPVLNPDAILASTNW